MRTASRPSGADPPLEEERSHNRPGSDKTVSFLCDPSERGGAPAPLNFARRRGPTEATRRNEIARPTRKSVMIKCGHGPLLCCEVQVTVQGDPSSSDPARAPFSSLRLQPRQLPRENDFKPGELSLCISLPLPDCRPARRRRADEINV